MTERYANFSALNISGPDEDGILDICIDTPGKLNAVDEAKHLALADVWKAVDSDPDTRVVVIHGANGTFSAGVDMGMIEKIMDDCMIAWAMNDEDIPLQNGFPLRLVCAGWPGSVSGKWLNRLVIRNKVHDGEKMAAPSYSVPNRNVAPGSRVPSEDMQIIESMPVKSLVTYPQSGIDHDYRQRMTVRGHAWAGDNQISGVFLSIDFGATWLPTAVGAASNRLSWQSFESWVQFPEPGYYEIWARAMDNLGRSQPMVVPGWNPRGYLNNACHRVAVQAT